ncbi:unnamed protein product [Trifolium pratense]|uniref:Uncharacterized protein n=1 Tax=Trifolium pratense TaxID=57577 RepID=A0ACB0JXB8_TRIPR|nr:unnamed protein product [Trifolium pratense]
MPYFLQVNEKNMTQIHKFIYVMILFLFLFLVATYTDAHDECNSDDDCKKSICLFPFVYNKCIDNICVCAGVKHLIV